MNSRIKNIISKILSISTDDIQDDSSSDSLQAWDSLGHMKIVLALEEEFDIRFDEVQITEMTSVSKICQTIDQLLT